MKPHEENDWTVPDDNISPTSTQFRVVRERGGVVAHGMTKQEATLIAAAPEMARALLSLLGDGPSKHLSFCHTLRRPDRACHPDCFAVRAALNKAGVL